MDCVLIDSDKKYIKNRYHNSVHLILNNNNIEIVDKSNRKNHDEDSGSYIDYRRFILKNRDSIKYVFLTGRPTLHPNIREIIHLNNNLKLKTIVFTFEDNTKILETVDTSRTLVIVIN